MRNKKAEGSLISNLGGIVIALIGLLIFLYALVQLYNVNVNQETENAKKVLNNIVAKIEALEDGESNSFAIQGVEEWYLIGWNKRDSLMEKPEKCSFNSCVCICPEPEKNFCQSEGICKSIEKEGISVYGYSAWEDTTGGFSKPPIYGRFVFGCAKLEAKLFQFNIDKQPDSLNLSVESVEVFAGEYRGLENSGYDVCEQLSSGPLPTRLSNS